MLEVVKITNLALISKSTVEFGEGFNVLTGETGAGKSLIIDALLFLTGIRADKTLIKSGEDSAKVEGVFSVDVNDKVLNDILSSVGIENEGTLIISRFFSLNGKNECRINGELVTLNILRKVSNELLDIFGQNDSQMLLDINNHLKLFDSVYTKEFESLKSSISLKLNELSEINNNIKLLGGLDKDRDNNIALLKYQIEEIENGNLYIGEDEDIKNKINIMQNIEKIYCGVSRVNELLSGETNVASYLKSAINSLTTVESYDEDLLKQKERLYSLKYELEDVISELYIKLNSLEYSEEEFNKLQDRLVEINDLKRKYGNSIEDILNKKEEFSKNLDILLNSSEEIERLRLNKNYILKELTSLCRELSNLRKKKGDEFSKNLITKLQELGMRNSSFKIDFLNEFNEDNIEKLANEDGADNIEFLFSANLGVEPRSLNKIISGGEMSRFMLAFKSLNSDKKKTCIFDEIDSGIGGEIGAVVGKKICDISNQSQVICITHLAQIASFGDRNYRIHKFENDNTTITEVNLLNENDKVIEIARMLGNSTKESSITHAKEVIEDSFNYKKYLKAI